MKSKNSEKWAVGAKVPDEVYTDREEFLAYFYEAALKAARRRTMSTVLLGQRRMGKTEIFKRIEAMTGYFGAELALKAADYFEADVPDFSTFR